MNFKLVAVILGIVVVIFGAMEIQADPEDWIIDGNRVYIDDNKTYISIEPHTIYSSDWVYFNFTSKVYTGDVDFIWGFNTSTIRPSELQIYRPTYFNTTKSFTCACEGYVEPLNVSNAQHDWSACWFNYSTTPTKQFWCWQNVTNNLTLETNFSLYYEHPWEWANLSSGTAFWNVTNVVYWQNLNGNLQSQNHVFGGMNKWWILDDVPIVANKSYLARAFLRVPTSRSGVQGKYWFAFKPSSQTLQQAIANNNLYYIDPWYNVSWEFHENITILNNNDTVPLQPKHTLNISLNLTGLIDDGKALLSGDDVRIIHSNISNELDRYIIPSTALYVTENNQFVQSGLKLDRHTSGTITAWIYPTQPADDVNMDSTGVRNIMRIVSSNTSPAFALKLSLGIARINEIGFSINGGTTDKIYTSSSPISDLNQWYHIAARWNGSFWSIWVNGEQLAVEANPEGVLSTSIYVFIGGALHFPDQERGFFGAIDDVSIWERALTDAEIETLANTSRPIKSSWFDMTDITAVWHFDNQTGTVIEDSSGIANTSFNRLENGSYLDEGKIVENADFNNTIQFGVFENISGGANDTYAVYYGNPNAGSPPANRSNIHYFFWNEEDISQFTNVSTGGTPTVNAGGTLFARLSLDGPDSGHNILRTIQDDLIRPLTITQRWQTDQNDRYGRATGGNYSVSMSFRDRSITPDSTSGYNAFFNETDGWSLNVPGEASCASQDGPGILESVSTEWVLSVLPGNFIGYKVFNVSDWSLLVSLNCTPSQLNVPSQLDISMNDNTSGVQFFNITHFKAERHVNPAPTTSLGTEATRPTITFQVDSPQNIAYPNTSIELNVSVTRNTSAVAFYWYEYNGNGTNITFTPNTTFFASGLSGNKNITITVNLTDKTSNSTTVNFVLDLDPPAIFVDSPQNLNYSTRIIELNASAVNISLLIDTFWYQYNGNGTNITFTPNTTFFASGSDGLKNITVYVNNSGTRENSTTINFTLDITAPILTGIEPQNDTEEFINTIQIHPFRVNVSDATTGVQSVTLDFNGVNRSGTVISGNMYEVNVTSLGKGIYNFQWFATDFANNTVVSNIFQYNVIDTSNQGSGGAGAGVSLCGNDVCDLFETYTTCPQDCKTPQKFTIAPEIHLAQALPESEAVCVGLGGCKIIVTNDDPNRTLLITTTIRQVGSDQSYQWAEFVPDVIPVNGGPKTQTSFEIESGTTKVITFKTTVPKEVPLGNYKYNIEFKSVTETKNVAVDLEVVDSSFALAFTGISNGMNNFLNVPIFQIPNSRFGQGTIVVWHVLAAIIVTGLVLFIILRK